jgi:hypothetical protein
LHHVVLCHFGALRSLGRRPVGYNRVSEVIFGPTLCSVAGQQLLSFQSIPGDVTRVPWEAVGLHEGVTCAGRIRVTCSKEQMVVQSSQLVCKPQ